MNIVFDTERITADEAKGVISLLANLFSTLNLYPVSPSTSTPPAPANEEQAIFGVPVLAQPDTQQPASSEQIRRAQVAQDVPDPAPSSDGKRHRRTKAEIEAEKVAAAQTPTTAAGAELKPVAESAKTTDAKSSVTTEVAAAAVTADQLRTLLSEHIARHSMEDAIGKLRDFGCNRVTEALQLEPAKLSALAEALRG
jgi:hypothetical protein